MKQLKSKAPSKTKIATAYRKTTKVLAKATEKAKPQPQKLQVVYTNDSGGFKY